MKLKKITKDSATRIALTLHESVQNDLEQYRAYYKHVYGDDISMSVLVEEMVKRFMAEDKDFQKFLAATRDQGEVTR